MLPSPEDSTTFGFLSPVVAPDPGDTTRTSAGIGNLLAVPFYRTAYLKAQALAGAHGLQWASSLAALQTTLGTVGQVAAVLRNGVYAWDPSLTATSVDSPFVLPYNGVGPGGWVHVEYGLTNGPGGKGLNRALKPDLGGPQLFTFAGPRSTASTPSNVWASLTGNVEVPGGNPGDVILVDASYEMRQGGTAASPDDTVQSAIFVQDDGTGTFGFGVMMPETLRSANNSTPGFDRSNVDFAVDAMQAGTYTQAMVNIATTYTVKRGGPGSKVFFIILAKCTFASSGIEVVIASPIALKATRLAS